jgi:hypothetical protein
MLPRAGIAVRAVTVVVLFSGCDSSSNPVAQSPVIQLDQANTPPWTGGWTVIGASSAVVRLAQSFTPSKSALTGIEIDLITANPPGSAQITVKVVSGNQTLAATTQTIAAGFDGIRRFDFPSAVNVTPGVSLQIQVEDSTDRAFGWRYGSDAYPAGVAFFNGAPWNGGAHDFFFRTYGY